MSSVPRELRSELIYAAAAVNAWLRGMPVAKVALHYRYEPVTALHLIRRCCEQYGETNLAAWVPANVRSVCASPSPRQRACCRPNGYDRDMAIVHMTEAELLKNIADVMRQVRQGSEIVIEQDNRPVAVIKPSKPAGRMISEVIADLKARGSTAVMDDDFARDIEEGIQAHRQPWNPPSWD